MSALHPERPVASVEPNGFDGLVSSALVALFRPIAKLCFAMGLTHRTVTNAVRRAFVEVASQQRTRAGKAPTYSKISLLTGIDRKQVVDILSTPQIQVKRNPAVEIIRDWNRDRGQELTVRGRSGDTFQALVRNHCADLSYTTLLNYLEGVGAVEKTGSGQVARKVESLQPDDATMARFAEAMEHLRKSASTLVTHIVDDRDDSLDAPLTASCNALDSSRLPELEADLNAALVRCRDLLQDTLRTYRVPDTRDPASRMVALYRYR